MRKMRCHAQLDVHVGERVTVLWPGLEVDVDRELAPGLTLAEALGHHLEGFTPAASPDADETVGTDELYIAIAPEPAPVHEQE